MKDDINDSHYTIRTIKAKALDISPNNLIYLATDTCNPQKCAWRKAHTGPDLKGLFIVGCNLHGLQLLIKDLIDPGKDENKQPIDSEIRLFWKLFTSIISHFSTSKKQLGILRTKMMMIVHKKYLSVIIRCRKYTLGNSKALYCLTSKEPGTSSTLST